MDYSKIALFTDLDGTLFNSERRVSTENREAIEYFIAAGGSFGISTGRAPANALKMLPQVPINSWSVTLNGAQAYHFEKECSAAISCLPKASMEKLLRWVLAELPQVNIQLCTDRELLFLSRRDTEDADFVSSHQPMRRTDLDSAMEMPWLKVLFCAPRPVLVELLAYARSRGAAEGMDHVFSHEMYLEFLPQNVNKGSCLKALRQQPQLRDKVFLAVGDYTNDLELLEEADVAVAVANALPEVLAAADRVVCSNDAHAIAHIIHKLIPSL